MHPDNVKLPDVTPTDVLPTGPLSLPTIRLYVLERMLRVWGMLGGPIVAVVAADDISAGRYGAAAFYVAAYAVVMICLFPRFLPYHLRAGIPLLVLYVVGSHEILNHGLNSAGSLFYFALTLFSCTLLGARASWLVSATALISLCVYEYRYIEMRPSGPDYGSLFEFVHRECLPDLVSLALLSAMGISFFALLLKNLEYSLQNSQQYMVEIAKERNHLIQLIEERDQAEKQLQQAQKMEAVGQLAGGIAHDFNNLLQVVTAHTEILLSKCEPDSERKEHLVEVRKAADRAASLTGQVLAYSRRQVMDPVYLDLNLHLEELAGMLHRVMPEYIETRLIPGADLGTVHADPVQLEQVLLNICLNARDAMPDGGILTISSENATIDEEFCANNPDAEPGSFVLVRVTDTGIGMAGEQQDHIFEPFYTTKELGKGTGLGLAMAYGIVKQHGGIIVARSEAGSGSEFSIYLPRVDHAASVPAKELPRPTPRGSETILMAEDDVAVRSLLLYVLKDAGFTVLAAEDGQEALELFAQNSETIDLLLFDVVMPRLGGREACQAIRATNPDLRVLFMSGYAPEGLSGGFELGKTTGFIQKPFRTADLLEKVREVIDGQGA